MTLNMIASKKKQSPRSHAFRSLSFLDLSPSLPCSLLHHPYRPLLQEPDFEEARLSSRWSWGESAWASPGCESGELSLHPIVYVAGEFLHICAP